MIFILIITIFLIYILKGLCENMTYYVYGHGKPLILLLGGVHGNEPSGCVGLKEIIKEIENKEIVIKKGSLIIIPCVNKCGLWWDTRTVPFRIQNRDINRNFPDTIFGSSKCLLSERIQNYIHAADFIIDTHEGWGWNKLNSNSMGSTITPSKHTVEMAKKIVDKLNKDIKSDKLQFSVWTKWKEEKKGTLRYYCKLLNKKYILLETSGQNNIQDIRIRKEQVKTTVNHVLKSMEII
jgi:hypothetical protein